MALLTNDRWREHLAHSINGALDEFQFELCAFVFMPEHVHLLVFPTRGDTTCGEISTFLARLKVGCSQAVKADLEQSGSRLLEKLTIRERPDRMVFRFWQEGPGYDRNMPAADAVDAAIEYIHMNPIRRGLCKTIRDWRWSSARWYQSEGQDSRPHGLKLHGPPPELYDPC